LKILLSTLLCLVLITGLTSMFGCTEDPTSPPPYIGQRYFVSPDSSGDFPTIQDAINSVQDGDTIDLANGVFMGEGNRDISFLGKEIVVQSQSGNPSKCVIKCEGLSEEYHRGFFFQSGETSESVLEGVTIRKGLTHAGGGVLCQSSSPTLIHVRFEENISDAGGGLFVGKDSAPILSGCEFTNNSALLGGGIFSDEESSPLIVNCNFEENQAKSNDYAGGGGLLCNNAEGVVLTNCTFANNTSDAHGGALYCEGGMNLTECTFTDNQAIWSGGGAYLVEGAPKLTDCIFTGNNADTDGGGLALQNNLDVKLTGCEFRINTALVDGGGIFSNSSSPILKQCEFISNSVQSNGGGVYATNCDSIIISDCLFTGNTAEVSGGGLVSGSSIVNQCIFSSNTSENEGGGILFLSSSAIQSSTLYGNEAPEGGGIACWGDGDTYSIERVIISFGGIGEAVSCDDGIGVVSVKCSNVYGNEEDWFGCIEDDYGINANIAADPLFCQPLGGDFNLQTDSPCGPDSSACGQIGALDIGC